MHWLLGGYMWLFVHRPFEYYPMLGDLLLERVYMLLMLVYWAVSPGKGFALNRLHVALTIFTSVLTICWLNSPWRDLCGDVVENQLKVMVFYFLFVTSVRDEEGLRRVLKFYFIAVSLYMAHSMLEFANGRYEWRMGIVRMIGVDVTFRDPNSFASTLLLAIVLTLPLWSFARSLQGRLPLLSFTAAAILCVLLTGSRTGFMGLGVVALFALLVSRANKGVIALVVVGMLLIAMLLPGSLQDRFLTIVNSSYGPENARQSGVGRLLGFLASLDLFEKSPVLGVGPGAFAYATGQGFNPHNLYGQLVAEMGLVGAGAFAIVLTSFWMNWRETRRLYRDNRWQHDIAYLVSRSVTLNVLLMLFLGFAGHNLYRYMWVWIAAFQAAAVQIARMRAAEVDKATRAARLPLLIRARRPRMAVSYS